jgi:hypothetical protein
LQYVDIFRKINRSDELLNYYYRCRQVPIEQFWSQFEKSQQLRRPSGNLNPNIPSNPNVNPPVAVAPEVEKDNAFIKWLPTFYDEVLLMLTNEVNFLIFKSFFCFNEIF